MRLCSLGVSVVTAAKTLNAASVSVSAYFYHHFSFIALLNTLISRYKSTQRRETLLAVVVDNQKCNSRYRMQTMDRPYA